MFSDVAYIASSADDNTHWYYILVFFVSNATPLTVNTIADIMTMENTF